MNNLFFLFHLRQLNVSHCSNVTDAGIKGLCVSVDSFGNEDTILGQCKLIEILATRGTCITNIGMKFGLDNLPALKVWDEVHVSLLFTIYKTSNLPAELKYSLLHLELRDERISSKAYILSSLGFGMMLCPSLTKLVIHEVEDLQDSDLLPVTSLGKLRELEILGPIYEKMCAVTFHGGVLPLLASSVGTSLQQLKLSRLRDVNIHVIKKFCPNLRSFKLMRNWSYFISLPGRELIPFRSTGTQGYFLK